jgi:hypothetical protein
MEFSGVFGFQPAPCNVARGNEKGKVENGIYFLRINFMAGRELLWPEVNLDVQNWMKEIANVRLHRTTRERPVDRWEREKPFLLEAPARPYDASIVLPVRSSHQALVRFDGNFYSVPHEYAYRTLVLKATSTGVRLFFNDQEISLHLRSYDRGAVVMNPKHFEGILATKRKHFGTILHKRFLELGPLAQAFLEGLRASEVSPFRHLQRILNLVSTYGKGDVLFALQHAISCNAFGASYVENILLQHRSAKQLPELQQLDIPQRPDWNDLATEEPDLSLYDRDPEEPENEEP